LGAIGRPSSLFFLFWHGGEKMTEKKSSFPNVSLGGKLNKQKGEKHAGNLRYREKDDSDSITKK
jgi:hypothetical protein